MLIEPASLSFSLENSNPEMPLGIEILLDNDILYCDSNLTQPCKIQKFFNDEDADHTLVIKMFGKTINHTTVDQDNNIVKDSVIKFTSLCLDGVDITSIMHQQTQYCHNFNGTGNDIIEPFFGVMGCNGTVTMKFTTPVYMWLLECM